MIYFRKLNNKGEPECDSAVAFSATAGVDSEILEDSW